MEEIGREVEGQKEKSKKRGGKTEGEINKRYRVLRQQNKEG